MTARQAPGIAFSILLIKSPFLTSLALIFLLITLGQLDLDLGLFYVMWSPSKDWDEVFLNGMGASLLFSMLAYLGYLIRAKENEEVMKIRLPLFACLVAPFIFFSSFPI